MFEIDVTLQRAGQTIVLQCASAGGVVALCGRSGAGKSSVLDMVAGLVTPDEGRIMAGGRVLFDSAAGINLPPEQRGCGYVFQDKRLFPHKSVEANLLYGWRIIAPEQRWITPQEVYDLLGLRPLLHRRPVNLSGGEAQRVAIGRALLAGARFLLLDEPLSALDAPRRAEIMGLIERIRDSLGLPMLYVSHQRDEVERLAALVVEMD